MPTFIDRHPLADSPSAVRQRLHVEAVQGFGNEHGAQPVWHRVTNGVIYCVPRAPRREASVGTTPTAACRATTSIRWPAKTWTGARRHRRALAWATLRGGPRPGGGPSRARAATRPQRRESDGHCLASPTRAARRAGSAPLCGVDQPDSPTGGSINPRPPGSEWSQPSPPRGRHRRTAPAAPTPIGS
jgi:hypothetical protein